MTDPYDASPELRVDRPAQGVLRITLDGPGLNAVRPAVHRELADVWLAVDRDPDTRVALLRGRARRSPPGGASTCSTRYDRLRGPHPDPARGP